MRPLPYKLFLGALAVLATGCGVLIVPTGNRLAVRSFASSLSLHGCYPLELDLPGESSGGQVIFSIGSGSAAVYGSQQACEWESPDGRVSTLSFLQGQTGATVYVRVLATSVALGISLGGATATSIVSSAVAPTPFSDDKGASDMVWAITRDPSSSKIYAAGPQAYRGHFTNGLARVNADGTVDPTFALVGTALNSTISDMAVQGDGKLIVVGAFTQYDGVARPYIARLNTDGSLDTSFSTTGTGLNASASAVEIQSDGAILIGGSFTSYNGTALRYVCRLNSDGTLDGTFAHVGTGLSSSVTSLVIQPSNGKIVVGGFFTSYNGTAQYRIARLETNGSLDPSFNPTGTGLDNGVYALALRSDERIIAAGSFTSYDLTSQPYIALIDVDGSLDASFNPVGTGLNNHIYSVSVQSDDKAIVGGLFTQYNGATQLLLARIDVNGSRDTSFAGAGLDGQDTQVRAVALQANGQVLVGGVFSTCHGASCPANFARFNVDGSVDSTFSEAGERFNSSPSSIAFQSDGKIVVGGNFNLVSGIPRTRVARLNADGSLDTSFTQTGTSFGGSVNTVAVQADGKILVGGEFQTFNGSPQWYLARLNSDGTYDGTFSIGTGFDAGVQVIVPLASGKILVAGSFSSYNGNNRRRILRLESDGSLDASFTQTGTGLNSIVRSVQLQADGKILVGGYFTNYNGTAVDYVARLNDDGSLDPSFAPSAGGGLNSFVTRISLGQDGKVVAVGYFVSYGATARPYVARLNSDGSLDTSFAPTGTGLNGITTAVHQRFDGRVLVVGQFTSYNGTPIRRIARLASDGSLDTSFTVPTGGFGNTVSFLMPSADGSLYITGSFGNYGAQVARGLVRLTSGGVLR